MVNYLCRICSSKEGILDTYHSQLEGGGEQLGLYIQSASGILIQKDDPISRMVCHRCCEIAIKLHKYRATSVENDKLLKEKFGQPYIAPISVKVEATSSPSEVCLDNKQETCRSPGDPLDVLNGYMNRENLRLSASSVNDKAINLQVNSNINKDSASAPLNIIKNNALPTVLPTATTDRSQAPPIDKINFSESISNCDRLSEITNDSTAHPQSNTTHKCALPSNSHKNKATDMLRNNSSTPVNKHPSVQKLLNAHTSLILPTDVHTADVSPVISLDATAVSDWYASQLRRLKEQLEQITSNSRTSISSDEETNLIRPRLRKRNYRKIIDYSESDEDADDDFVIPKKITRSKTNRNMLIPTTIPAIFPDNAGKALPNHDGKNAYNNTVYYNRLSHNSVVVNAGNVTQSQQPEYQIIGYVPASVIPNIVLPTLTATAPITQSNLVLTTSPPYTSSVRDSMLQTILQTPNAKSVSNLWTDFSKYGINIETSEPPIQFDTGNSIESLDVNGPLDLATDEEVICISDDEECGSMTSTANTVLNTVTNRTSRYAFESREKEIIKSLFKKYSNSVKSTDKSCETRKITNAIIHRTKHDMIALQNMWDELKRYKVPIQLNHSKSNKAHFINNVKRRNRSVNKFWSLEESVTLQKPSLLNNPTITYGNTTISNPSSTPSIINPYSPLYNVHNPAFRTVSPTAIAAAASLDQNMGSTVTNTSKPRTILPKPNNQITESQLHLPPTYREWSRANRVDKTTIPITVNDISELSARLTEKYLKRKRHRADGI